MNNKGRRISLDNLIWKSSKAWVYIEITNNILKRDKNMKTSFRNPHIKINHISKSLNININKLKVMALMI